MKFMFVVGGSYKSFYLNKINKIKDIDLLVFHQDIFYDFDYEREYLLDAPVSKELIALNKKFKCPILVYGNFNREGNKTKCFILCVNEKVSVIDGFKDIYLYIKGKFVLIGDKLYSHSKAFATISIVGDNQNWNKFPKNHKNNYFACDKKGITAIIKGKIYRKFQKCCYFILKKNK